MGSYWDGVKRRWAGMVDAPPPPPKSGSGSSGTGSGGGSSGSGGETPGKEWELIYQKFRRMKGRDPYSFQELKDWWG